MTIKDKWRKNVIETALKFVNVKWVPTEKNLYHGYDENGVLVNTPDVNYSSPKYNGWWKVDRQNQGIPYNLGGFCTIEEFQKEISEGRFAGNIPDSLKNKRSRQCTGVDCSGFVSVCWGLREKYSTKTLSSVAHKLDTTESLLPGDIFLLSGNHVMLFLEFADNTKSSAKIIDATRKTGKVSVRTKYIKKLEDNGYAGYSANNCVFM